MEPMEASDAALVAECLTGNREAFGHIVARYQTLICSLAYSSTGNLTQSEDLAQETFVAAWKQLGNLREPEKLRSWLCTIARNLTYDSLKQHGREPAHAAEALDAIPETHADEPSPQDFAISHEEAAILWRSLERIPDTYREPLILFCREHQSIQTVAGHLGLTEDNVKQRLSRGRKLLQEQVLAFVEGALSRTNPGQAFTLSVLAALPTLTISAKAATVGAAAAKGSATAKAAAATGLFAIFVGPALAFLNMWMGYRMTQKTAQTDRERAFNKSFYKRLVACVLGFLILYSVLIFAGASLVESHSFVFVTLVLCLAAAYITALTAFSIWCYRARRRLLADFTPAEIATAPRTAVWEYRSHFHLLGLPLLHMRIGDRMGQPLRAWIAIGDCAFGGLFAFGGIAVAPISIGGCALGLFSFGGFALAVIASGGMAVGGWAFGGLAIGWQSDGGCAIALNAAWGGYAIARDFALGGIAHAAQTTNDSVFHVLKSFPFFRAVGAILPYLPWFNLVWVIPMIVQWCVISVKTPGQKIPFRPNSTDP